MFARTRLVLAASALVLAACSDSSTDPGVVPVTRSITVDASAAWTFLALDTIAQGVTVTTPTTSSAWDVGFFSTGVMLNGGAAGPGGVTGYCLCDNAAATTPQIQAFTADNQLAAFDSVTAADIPAAASFQADVLDPAINGWVSGSGAAASVVSGRTYLLRKVVGGSAVISKVQVTAISGATAATPGQVTFQYATQATSGGAFSAAQSATVAVSAGTLAYFDFAAGAPGTPAAWDVAFDGWAIRSNGGVSGTAGVTGLVDPSTPFASIDAAYVAPIPSQAYRADRFGGVFLVSPWYKYNITGTDNQIWPLFNVYLIRRGSEVYKVQLTGYYSATGVPRNIAVRYARLAE